MATQVILKTTKTIASVADYIAAVDPAYRIAAKTLLELFTEVTGAPAKMWGTSIVGFGEYTYHRSNGKQGTFLATGFSIRKSGPTLYIMPGYQNYASILKQLGPHKLGKSCLYLKSVEEIDLKILKTLIETGLKDLQQTHLVVLK